MPQPTVGSVHTDAILTNISVAYAQSASNFVSTRVFPIVPVQKQSDSYVTYTKNDWFRDEVQRRGDATESAGSGYNVSTASYSCDVWGLHKDVGDQVVKNADAPINPEQDAVKFLTQRMLLRQEMQWAADYFVTSVWGTTTTPTNLWSDYVNSDPVDDIETGKRTIAANTGYMPNKLVLGYDVFRRLRNHPDIIDRVKYSGEGKNVSAQVLSTIFDVDEVMVCSAVKGTNVEGETAAYDFVQGKHALLCYAAPEPGLLTPSAGYTFAWSGISAGLGESTAISKFRMEQLKATRVEIEAAWDNKLVAADLGYFFLSCVA